MSQSQEWYVTNESDSDEVWGPFSSSEMLVMAREGTLSPIHLVRLSNKDQWKRASLVKDLRFEDAIDVMSDTWGELNWSEWIDLASPLPAFQAHVTKGPGFYRVRSTSCPGLVYVGQTGVDLRGRTRKLGKWAYSGIDQPPWNDPHTAAPVLWAYHHEDSFLYEVSVALNRCDEPERECHEDYLLYLHRLQFRHSTLANHGRPHPHWNRPSNKGSGRPTIRKETPKQYPSLPPAVGNIDSMARDWLGLEWSAFYHLPAQHMPSVAGVYRIKQENKLVYLGQSSNLKNRIRAHGKSSRFRNCDISVAAMPHADSHQLKEREVDLIGCYFMTYRCPPRQQYSPKP